MFSDAYEAKNQSAYAVKMSQDPTTLDERIKESNRTLIDKVEHNDMVVRTIEVDMAAFRDKITKTDKEITYIK